MSTEENLRTIREKVNHPESKKSVDALVEFFAWLSGPDTDENAVTFGDMMDWLNALRSIAAAVENVARREIASELPPGMEPLANLILADDYEESQVIIMAGDMARFLSMSEARIEEFGSWLRHPRTVKVFAQIGMRVPDNNDVRSRLEDVIRLSDTKAGRTVGKHGG